jgi:hypothetical protein
MYVNLRIVPGCSTTDDDDHCKLRPHPFLLFNDNNSGVSHMIDRDHNDMDWLPDRNSFRGQHDDNNLHNYNEDSLMEDGEHSMESRSAFRSGAFQHDRGDYINVKGGGDETEQYYDDMDILCGEESSSTVPLGDNDDTLSAFHDAIQVVSRQPGDGMNFSNLLEPNFLHATPISPLKSPIKLPMKSSLRASIFTNSPRKTSLSPQNDPSMPSSRSIQFADVIAVDIEATKSLRDRLELFDIIEPSFVEQQPNSTKSLPDAFNIFGERCSSGSNRASNLETETSFESDDDFDFEDESQGREKSDAAENPDRKILYAIGGAGAMALLSIAVQRVFSYLSNMTKEDDDPLGAADTLVDAAGHRAPEASDSVQAVLMHGDGGATLMAPAGSIGRESLSSSLSAGQGGGVPFVGGGEQVAVANPALQR